MREAHLQEANFSHSLLNGSDLTYANCRKANLTEVQARRTNFSNTDLTGAIIQDWNINQETIFANVFCDYVYLNQDKNNQSRRPLKGNFRTGEFENLVTHLTQALGFILHDDDDPDAFFRSLAQLIQTYSEQSLELGNIIRLPNGDRQFIVNTPPDFDNAKAYVETMANYENLRKELAASRQEIKLLESQLNNKNTDLVTTRQQLEARTNELITAQRESLKYLQGFMSANWSSGDRTNIYQPQITDGSLMSKNNPKIEIKNKSSNGNNITNVAGRDLNGDVAIAINSLKETDNNSEIPNLADLLEQLQTAINESDADEKQKNILLTQVKKLTETAKLPTSEGLKEAAAESINIIEAIAGFIPSLGKAVTSLLAAISNYFASLP